ncbi:MAG: 2-succinyl-5-enolpyruvyl-6-hydroxy-3-cyclohexene-carboxylate synthase [Thermoanaerobaculia bacterium]|jgi:2-succinyl-5-enolpyruvyl-6-hydroxy-3-cyclohexene-1-carboxylate synthase|nr:2-succinyl-5-enolpyruvyl-6-hydroxy-3-cyclohexene-carboxylate synthase [Thermoanaerobaculia bacterium]
MTNIAEARRVIEEAVARGATDFCVCAGSRNAPLLAVLGVSGLRVFSFVDERSAAFFALGRAKLTGRPAVVVTTSGTAVAELLPAAIEAHYSATPLILITADRPARYRGTGAPQTIEQEEIFGVYGRGSVQHVNVEFDEPLIDEEVSRWNAAVSAAGQAASSPPQQRSSRGGEDAAEPAGGDASVPVAVAAIRPLVLLGGLHARDRNRVRAFAIALNAPVYAEPLSGLREDPALAHLLITAGERMIGRGDFDGVIRIGNVPTARFWRDLDESRRDLPLISFSALPFTGCARGEVHPIEALPDNVTPRERDESFFAADRERATAIEQILDAEPESELALLRELSLTIPKNSRVYLGNSLPIREWDLASTRDPRGFTIEANRGANGIDGQLSTFLGQCDPTRTNVCVIGDLTAIYDSNAPWVVPQLDPNLEIRIVIMNNGGGRIFSRVASLKKLDEPTRERIIENSHAIRFEHWAAMWGMGYAVVSDVRGFARSRGLAVARALGAPPARDAGFLPGGSRQTIDASARALVSEAPPAQIPRGGNANVIELRPDPESTRRAWAKYDALW